MNYKKPYKTVFDGIPHIWLQEWGYHPALSLSQLEAGMKIRYNGGSTSEVLEVGRPECAPACEPACEHAPSHSERSFADCVRPAPTGDAIARPPNTAAIGDVALHRRDGGIGQSSVLAKIPGNSHCHARLPGRRRRTLARRARRCPVPAARCHKPSRQS